MKTTKYILNFTIAVAALFISGCAFTVHNVEVDPTYSLAVSRAFEADELESVTLGDFEDLRTNAASEKIIFHITNLNGDRTTGGWEAQERVADLVRASIEDGLMKANLVIAEEGGGLELSGQLVKLDYQVITGFWKGSLNSEMTVKLELKNVSSGMILWRDTFFAKDSTDKFEMEQIFQRLLEDLVSQIIEDDYFRQNLKAQN